MKKYFKIKFNDFICPDCGEKLMIPDIIKQLYRQYEPDTDEYGYLSLITADCSCCNRYKIYCDCHDWNDRVTVCVNKIKKLYKREQRKNEND